MKNSKTVSLPEVKKERLDSVISFVLTEERIPAERKGYHYLACAIEEVYADREMAGAVSKSLYPAVARAFSTSPEAVERSIRAAIACAQTAKDGGRRKTNSEFIFQAAEQVKMLIDRGER